MSLYEVFVRLYGDVDSKPHCAAREAFVRSMAAYAVVCMVLKLKDRYARTRTRVHVRLREAWRCGMQHATRGERRVQSKAEHGTAHCCALWDVWCALYALSTGVSCRRSFDPHALAGYLAGTTATS